MKHSKKFQLFLMCLILSISILTHVPGSIAEPDYSFLNFGTYLGGSHREFGYSITTDSNNNVYVTGDTSSSDFPTLNAYNSTFGGDGDAFVSSFTSDGSLRWSTYLGGSSADYGYSIAIDSNNSVYVTGYTESPDFPRLNAYNGTFGGKRDAFVSSFSSDGSLRWSTYLGGSSDDYGEGIAIDSNNNVYVTGDSSSSDFPTLNAYNSNLGGDGDAFMSSFSSDGSLRWSTYLGGSSADYGYSIAIDSDNRVYVTGYTESPDFPTLNAYNSNLGGDGDAFVSSFTSDGSLRWSTYLGGSSADYGYSIAIDSNNNVYVTGLTWSSDFPTLNAYDSTYGGEAGCDVFVSSFTSDGSLRWSTYLGSPRVDSGAGIAIDSNNNVYVTGYTYASGFPTLNAYNSTFGGDGDAFVSSFSSDGSLRWSTYLGSSGHDGGTSIAIDSNNNVYVTGYTSSFDFPTLNAYDSTLGGDIDVFVNSFSSDGEPTSNTSASPSDPLSLDLFVFIFSLVGIVIIQKKRH